MKFLWTTINVKSLDESISFYSELLELKLINRFPAGNGREIAFMGNGIKDETLVEFISDSTSSKVNFGESISIGFEVKSADSMIDIVKSKNIPIHSGPFETPKFKFFCIKDPNGLNIQFFQNK